MNFNGNTFSYVFKNVQKDFRYFVASGHERSRIISVTVVELPKIEKLSLRLRYPEYTRKADDMIEDFQGDIVSLIGTTATLHLRSSQPLQSAELCLATQNNPLKFDQLDGAKDIFAVNFKLIQDDVFRIQLVNADGRESQKIKEHNIKVLPDLLPQIKIQSPAQNSLRQPVNSSMSLILRVFDDFGIEQIKMIIEHADRRDERVLFRNLDSKNVKQQMSSKFELEFPEVDFKVGETISLHFEASDYNPNRPENEKYAISRAIEIFITEPNVVDEMSVKLLADVILRLGLLLNKQRLTKRDTELLIKRINRDRIRKIKEALALLDTEQREIRNEIVEISKISNVEEFPRKDAPKILDELAGGAAYEIIKLSSELVKLNVKKEQINTLNKIV
ncbi:MAG: hypothetical protein KAR20_26785, partial [Candidatus Heimdallarchaeota archaeon]|nr:hypothetical protein [Candidatus Heimdallarchaeota archaeon]